MSAVLVISPARTTSPLFTSTSQATRLLGSFARCASRIESAMNSHTLSGCPSLTDSEVNTWDVSVGFIFLLVGDFVGAVAVMRTDPADVLRPTNEKPPTFRRGLVISHE